MDEYKHIKNCIVANLNARFCEDLGVCFRLKTQCKTTTLKAVVLHSLKHTPRSSQNLTFKAAAYLCQKHSANELIILSIEESDIGLVNTTTMTYFTCFMYTHACAEFS